MRGGNPSTLVNGNNIFENTQPKLIDDKGTPDPSDDLTIAPQAPTAAPVSSGRAATRRSLGAPDRGSTRPGVRTWTGPSTDGTTRWGRTKSRARVASRAPGARYGSVIPPIGCGLWATSHRNPSGSVK